MDRIVFSSLANSRPFLPLQLLLLPFIMMPHSPQFISWNIFIDHRERERNEKKRLSSARKEIDSRDRSNEVSRSRVFIILSATRHLDGSVQLSCHCTFNYFNESITPIAPIVCLPIHCMPPPAAAVKEYEEEEECIDRLSCQFFGDSCLVRIPLRQLGSAAADHFSASQLTRNGTCREFDRERERPKKCQDVNRRFLKLAIITSKCGTSSRRELLASLFSEKRQQSAGSTGIWAMEVNWNVLRRVNLLLMVSPRLASHLNWIFCL